MQQKTKKKTDLAVTALIIAGIIAVVNLFSYQIFYRWDITENKDFSISRASKDTAGNLDDIVKVKAYFSKNLPPQLLSVRQDVGDILDEYTANSQGKIRVEFIDPTGNDAMARELQMKGIPQLQFEVYEKDKLQLVAGYLGIEVSYGANSDVIPVVEQNASSLEYQITTSIKKVIKEEIGTIGVVTSNGALSLESEMSQADKKLKELYAIEQVDLASDKPEIKEDIKTLIIAGPKEAFNEKQLKAINSFVMRGGGLVLLYDGVKLGENLQASANDIKIDPLLDAWGIKVNRDLVLDAKNGYASFTQGFFRFSAPYPYWPKIEKDGFSQENPAVSGLESIILPWASSVEIKTDKLSETTKAVVLAKTTDKAWHISDAFDLNPQQDFKPQGEQKTFDLAVAVTGTLKSAYPEGKDEAKNKTDNGQVIVIADSDFAKDDLSQLAKDNLVFFQNVVDSLTIDSDLISIRSKGVSNRPIKELADGARAAIRYFNVFGITLIVVLFGMIRYYLRRKKSFVEEL